MAEPTEVLVPLLNPNEPEATVVAFAVADGAHVAAGDVLGELETTKSTEELASPATGFVVGLRAAPGDVVTAGDRLCWIAENATWVPPADAPPAAEADLPADLRITAPARALADELGVDLTSLPRGTLVTADVVRAHAPAADAIALPAARPGAVVVFGAGGHGRTLIDLLGARAGAVVDDGSRDAEVLGVPVVGGRNRLADLRAGGFELAANAVGGIGTAATRVAVSRLLADAGFRCPALVHPAAVVEPSASLTDGCQVLAGAYVGSLATVGKGSIVNTRAVVSHDCAIGEHAHVAPGALLAGAVVVGDRALVGMGVTVNIGVRIGADARIGNGAVVISDVPDGTVVRAGTTWPLP
jgi:sugar O-acyltransferase (sialic acid O-acetyltransferase NeuD family)